MCRYLNRIGQSVFIAMLITSSATGCRGVHGAAAKNASDAPAVFASRTGEMVYIYNDRIVVNGKTYRGVDCSTSEYNCMVFDPIGAILTPKYCDDHDFGSWRVGELTVYSHYVEPHTIDLMLSTPLYNHFAFKYSNDLGMGINSIIYESSRILSLTGPPLSMGDSFSNIGYAKVGGPNVFTCVANKWNPAAE